jgi:hypothetical protein
MVNGRAAMIRKSVMNARFLLLLFNILWIFKDLVIRGILVRADYRPKRFDQRHNSN